MTKRSNTDASDGNTPKRACTSSEAGLARSRIMARLSERALPSHLFELDRQYDEIYSLIDQTITQGESNSCLLIGNRGTGKSHLLRCVLNDLDKKYNWNTTSFCVVRLNGWIQTTDRLALNEMARQLAAYQQQGNADADASFHSFAESFGYLLSLLRSGDKSSLPVVFVLDEFDRFAHQAQQSVLYNLFDAAQSAQNPMIVIGLTSRMDTLLLLEKRVKSRYSHRQIYFFAPSTQDVFTDIARTAIQIHPTIDDDTSFVRYAEKFNSEVDKLFQEPAISSIMKRCFMTTKEVRMFFRIALDPVSRISEDQPFLRVEDFIEAASAEFGDAKTELLKGVSLLELLLVVAMKKLLEREITTFNFEMVYDEYKEFMNNTQVRGDGFGMKLYKRPVALKAFENLQGLELVCPVDTVARCPKEFRMNKLMLEQMQVREAVARFKNCPSMVMKWATGAA